MADELTQLTQDDGEWETVYITVRGRRIPVRRRKQTPLDVILGLPSGYPSLPDYIPGTVDARDGVDTLPDTQGQVYNPPQSNGATGGGNILSPSVAQPGVPNGVRTLGTFTSAERAIFLGTATILITIALTRVRKG